MAMNSAASIPWEFLHPEIASASREIVEAKKYDEAIFAAFRTVEAEVQERIQSKNIGRALLDEAFDGATPKIYIVDDSRDHQGIKELFSGALANIRNDRGHKKEPSLPCKTVSACFHYLSFASLLLYLLSKDRNILPRIESCRVFGSIEEPRAELRGANFGSNPEAFIGNEKAMITRACQTSIELVLPPRFAGDVRVALGENVSNPWHCDAHFLIEKLPNFYEVIHAEVPLFEDAACTKRRSDVVGMLIRAKEVGFEFLRITPVSPNTYKAGCFVSHGPFERTAVGESWYRDPGTGAIHYAWSSACVAKPDILGPVNGWKPVGLVICPSGVHTELDECRTLRAFGWFCDGEIRDQKDITDRVQWKSSDDQTIHVAGGVARPKKLGRARIECSFEGFTATAEVNIAHYAVGQRVTYFQGMRKLQHIRFDAEDNLYFCNQSHSVYRVAKKGGLEEVVQNAVPETNATGIDCIAVGADKTLYVNDINRSGCFRLRWDGKKYRNSESIANCVNGAKKGIAVDNAGHVFVAVMGPGQGEQGYVIHVEPNGTESYFRTNGMAICIAIGPGGNLYLPSAVGKAINVYDRSGALLNAIPFDRAGDASDILVDDAGVIYLPLFNSGELAKITDGAANPRHEVIGTGFQNPGGIAMDSRKRLFVSNFEGDSIDVIF